MTLLEQIFLDVLNLSETGSLVILAVLLLRCILCKIPRKFSYVLWAIPAIRLLVTISFPGMVKLPERFTGLGVQSALSPVIGGVSPMPDFGKEAAHTVMEGGFAQAPGSESPSLWFALACLWLAGMLLLAAKNGYDYYRLRKKLRVCMEWKRHIYLADGITQPFVLAGLPGKIYLPSGLCEEKRRFILMHEQVHLRRGDAFFKLIASLICCIHWFNPIVWLGLYYFNCDMEMSCDEAAAAGMDAAERRAYALELLYFSARQKEKVQLPCAFGEKGVKGRIMNLMREKRKTKAALALAGGVVLLAAVIFVPNFRGVGQTAPGASAAGRRDADDTGDFDTAKSSIAHEGAKGDAAGMNAAYPGTEKESPEDSMAADEASEQGITGNPGILEERILINGVPVSMRYQTSEFSGEDMEALAAVAYETFAEIYFSGERRPEQMYGLDGMSYDFETSGDLLNIFSDTEHPMIWRLSVTLPDNWKEDKGMGMMKEEDSQKQEYDIVLAQNAAGEWEAAESAWRAYYDNRGNFRWPE